MPDVMVAGTGAAVGTGAEAAALAGLVGAEAAAGALVWGAGFAGAAGALQARMASARAAPRMPPGRVGSCRERRAIAILLNAEPPGAARSNGPRFARPA